MKENAYKRFIWFGIATLLVITPILRGTVRTWSIMPVIFVIMFLVFSWLWRANNCREYKFKRTILDKPILLFVALAIISFVFSIYKYGSFYAFLRLMSYIGVYYLIVNNFDRNMVKHMMALIISMGTILSVYGLLQYFNVLPYFWRIPRNFLTATYVNHNHFAGYLELAIPLTIGIFFGISRRAIILKIITIGALILMISAFILAQSRGAWVCLIISLFIMSIILFKRRMINKTNIFPVLLCIVIIFSFIYVAKTEVSERLNTMINRDTEETSMQTRLEIWQGTIEMIKQRPLVGTGIGTFSWGFSRFRPEGLNNRANFAHNDFLHIAAEMGLIAFVVMVLILLMAIREGFKNGSSSTEVLGCSIGVLSLTLHGLVDFNFHITANMLLCSIFIAFIMKNSCLRSEE